VLLTSANAVRAIAMHRRFREIAALPAYVVGGRTREAAATAGFTAVVSANGDVDDLIALVAARVPRDGLPLLYLAGSDRAGDPAGALQSRGFRVETVVIYRSVMVADLRPDVRSALLRGGIDAVLHYSARSASAFVGALRSAGIEESGMKIKHLCLSAQVAEPLTMAGARDVVVAASPAESALFDGLGQNAE
jgi:uroporphyrinogen-III synthase